MAVLSKYCEPADYIEKIQGVILIGRIPKWVKVSPENKWFWRCIIQTIVKKKVVVSGSRVLRSSDLSHVIVISV